MLLAPDEKVNRSPKSLRYIQCVHRLLKPPLQTLFLFLLLHCNIWASLCRMIYKQNLTLEGCFHIYLLKVESSCGVIENPVVFFFKRWAYEDEFVTSQLAWKLIPAQYSTHTNMMWKLDSPSAQTLRMNDREKKETCCRCSFKYFKLVKMLI